LLSSPSPELSAKPAAWPHSFRTVNCCRRVPKLSGLFNRNAQLRGKCRCWGCPTAFIPDVSGHLPARAFTLRNAKARVQRIVLLRRIEISAKAVFYADDKQRLFGSRASIRSDVAGHGWVLATDSRDEHVLIGVPPTRKLGRKRCQEFRGCHMVARTGEDQCFPPTEITHQVARRRKRRCRSGSRPSSQRRPT
jgi:hypothetical protein